MRPGVVWLALASGACDASAPPPEVVFAVPPEAAWLPASEPPPAPLGELALVTNNFDDTVSYVDLGLDPPAEIARIPVGLNPIEREGPHHVSLAPDGETMWVGISNFVPGSGSGPHGAHGAGTADGYALALSVATGRLLASVRVDRNPGDIRMSPDGKFVALTHFDILRITEAEPGAPASALDSRVAIIEPGSSARARFVPACPAAHGIAIAPDSKRLFVACWNDRLADVDMTKSEDNVRLVDVVPLPGTIAEPECQPYALTQAPDGSRVWVGCYASGELLAYDPAAHAMVSDGVVDLGGAALFGAYVASDRLVVPSQGPDRLSWIDAESAAVVATLTFDSAECNHPHIVTPSADKQRLVLVCEGDRVGPGTLVVIDAASRTVQHVVPLGRFPDDLALRAPR